MMKHRVAQVGLGSRGRIHVEGFLSNSDRFSLVAVCDLDEERLEQAAEEYGISAGLEQLATYTDAEKMLAETKPDVFCFVTQPDVRLALVELGIRHEVKALAFEKPMATSLKEAWTIAGLCREHGIKAVVSHQQKYLTSMQKLRDIVGSGEIGDVTEIHATTQGWLSQLGTHFMDYIIWVNGGSRAQWVVGHVHGKDKLTDSHPSPDYLMGQVAFENGVRAFIECGYLSPSHMGRDRFWLDNRLQVYGSHGYAWADTDGSWGGLTRASHGDGCSPSAVVGGSGHPWSVQAKHRLQPLYLAELADWLDDEADCSSPTKVHPCNVNSAYHGYEILEGMCLSALDNVRVDLPLRNPEASADVLERMRSELPPSAPFKE
jgi:predicted dehydrogenase